MLKTVLESCTFGNNLVYADMLTVDRSYEGFDEIEEDKVYKGGLDDFVHNTVTLCSYLSEHPKLVSLFCSWAARQCWSIVWDMKLVFSFGLYGQQLQAVWHHVCSLVHAIIVNVCQNVPSVAIIPSIYYYTAMCILYSVYL